jgi:hypothetical protein
MPHAFSQSGHLFGQCGHFSQVEPFEKPWFIMVLKLLYYSSKFCCNSSKVFYNSSKLCYKLFFELLTTCDKFMRAMVLGLGFSMILLQELEPCCKFVKKSLWFIKILSQLVPLKFCCHFLKFCYSLSKLKTLL